MNDYNENLKNIYKNIFSKGKLKKKKTNFFYKI